MYRPRLRQSYKSSLPFLLITRSWLFLWE
uniref:Uncharacterized protein n=1 Tax=Anguilla anguilla TaxID=7936 RepID=A0A0E9TXP5_ANGAN